MSERRSENRLEHGAENQPAVLTACAVFVMPVNCYRYDRYSRISYTRSLYVMWPVTAQFIIMLQKTVFLRSFSDC